MLHPVYDTYEIWKSLGRNFIQGRDICWRHSRRSERCKNAHPFAISRKNSVEDNFTSKTSVFSSRGLAERPATPSSISVILFPRPRSHSISASPISLPPTTAIHPRCSRWSEVIKCPNCLIRAYMEVTPVPSPPILLVPQQPSMMLNVLGVKIQVVACG